MLTSYPLSYWLSLRLGSNQKTLLRSPLTNTRSLTSRLFGRGGGTSLLVSNKWKSTLRTLFPPNKYAIAFTMLMVTVPVKVSVVVIYYPPAQMGDFEDELALLSSIHKHGCPLLILGDMNIHLDNPSSKWMSLNWVCSPPTYKAGKQLDLDLNTVPQTV